MMTRTTLSSFRHMLALALVSLMALPVSAQNLPHHINTGAREDVSDFDGLSTIRFLTSTDFPPFNYRDAGGELVGFHIDLARAICDELDILCTIQSWPWDQIADALDEQQGDAMIAGLALDEASADRFDFSSIYLGTPARFVTHNADAANFDPQAAGLDIVVRDGTAHERFARAYLPEARIAVAPSEAEALEMVQTRQADAYFGDGLRAAFWLDANPACCNFAGEAYFRPDLFGHGYAMAIPVGRDEVRVAINAALVRLQRSGKMDELFLRWFPVSFY